MVLMIALEQQKIISVNFSKAKIKFCLSFHWNCDEMSIIDDSLFTCDEIIDVERLETLTKQAKSYDEETSFLFQQVSMKKR